MVWEWENTKETFYDVFLFSYHVLIHLYHHKYSALCLDFLFGIFLSLCIRLETSFLCIHVHKYIYHIVDVFVDSLCDNHKNVQHKCFERKYFGLCSLFSQEEISMILSTSFQLHLFSLSYSILLFSSTSCSLISSSCHIKPYIMLHSSSSYCAAPFSQLLRCTPSPLFKVSILCQC